MSKKKIMRAKKKNYACNKSDLQQSPTKNNPSIILEG